MTAGKLARPLFVLAHDPGPCSGAVWHTESRSDPRFTMRGHEYGPVLPSEAIAKAILTQARELGVEVPGDIEAWVLCE